MNQSSILIIEDEPALLRGLKDNFEAAGHRVRTCADGEEALRILLKDPPELVLLDIMLPGKNGFEICRQARERGLEMPIIMLTARGQEEDIIQGLELGADDYMAKPFSIRELMARAGRFIRRRRGGEAGSLQFGTCRLDVSAHKFFKNGAEAELTTKEYRLLEYFLKRPGRALTRDQILDAVWGNEIIVNTRSVDRCVTTLRAKVEPDPRQPVYIHTVRDIGYRFEPPE